MKALKAMLGAELHPGDVVCMLLVLRSSPA